MFSTVSLAYATGDVDSPKKQVAYGIEPLSVQCNIDFQLMIRMSGDAACVTPSTAEKLENAGWGEIFGDVVTELPSHDSDLELEESLGTEGESFIDDSKEEHASHKIELKESMQMAGN